MRSKVSVIVPVYNSEAYLDACMKSLLEQTYENIEILLIDDGSREPCRSLCDRYASEKVRVFHKPNGGQSTARNLGIEKATGDYLAFVDSDDETDSRYVETLLSLCEKYRAEIAVCEQVERYPDREVRKAPYPESCVSGEEAMRLALSSKRVYVGPCNKLFSRQVWGDFRFTENRIYEDAELMPQVLFAAERVAISGDALYYYCFRQNSTTTQAFSPRHLDMLAAYESVGRFVQANCPENMDVVRFRMLHASFLLLDKMLAARVDRHSPMLRERVSYLRKHIPEILKDPNFTVSRKLGAVLLRCSVGLYAATVTLKNRHSTL